MAAPPPWASDPKADINTLLVPPTGLRGTAAAPANVPSGSPLGGTGGYSLRPPADRNNQGLLTREEKIAEGIPAEKLDKPYRRDEAGNISLPPGLDDKDAKNPVVDQQLMNEAAMKAAGLDLMRGIDPVTEIIKRSTSGWLETQGAEVKGGLTGKATPGMEAIGALETIATDLTLQMTGGSLGNQISNTDRDFIAKRMGDVGNPNTPINKRLAAWEQVKKRMRDIAGITSPEERGVLPYTQASEGEGGQITAGPLQLPEPGQEQAPPGPGEPPAAPPGFEAPPQPVGEGDIGFSGNVPPETINPLSEQQQAAYDAWAAVNKKPTANQLIAFFDSIGATLQPANAKAIEEAAAAGAALRPGSEAKRDLTPEQKAEIAAGVEKVGAIGAGVKGATDTVTMGAADKIAAGVTALGQEGSFGENYSKNLEFGNAYDAALQEAHEGSYLAGQIIGAAGIPLPTGVANAATNAAMTALRAGKGRSAALKAARLATIKTLGKEGAAYGGAYGAGSADTLAEVPGNVVTGAAAGGAAGTGFGAYGVGMNIAGKEIAASPTGQKIVKWVGDKLSRDSSVEDAAREVAQAAQELDIDLPKYVAGGAKDAAKASALEKTPAGYNTLTKATDRMLEQSEAARTRIATDVGTPATSGAEMGGKAAASGKAQIKAERSRVGAIYDRAKTAAGNMFFPAKETDAALLQLVAAEKETLGGSKVGGILERMSDDLAEKKWNLTLEGARATRSNLRTELRTEAGLTATDADRIVNHVMGAIGNDIRAGLKAAGKDDAIALYDEADKAWATQRTLEDDVITPYIGKDGENWGDDVARKLATDAKGNGTRLAMFLDSQPPEVANHIRASLIARLGTAKKGVQGAEGDKFSLDEFLTNWVDIKDTRNLIFPKETVRQLDQLAKVAEAAKTSGASKNRSNAGFPMWAAAKQTGAHLLSATALAQADWKLAAANIAMAGFYNMKQFTAAKLLASPAFAKRLAMTPKSPKGAKAFWSRSLQNMARVNPEIESELLEFQKNVIAGFNDNEPAEKPQAAAAK